MAIFKKYVTMDQVKSAFEALSVPNDTDLDTFVKNGLDAIKAKKEEAEALRQSHSNLVNEAKTARTATIEVAAVDLAKAKAAINLSNISGKRANAQKLLSAAQSLDKNPSVATLLTFAGVEPGVLTKMAETGNADLIEADRLEDEANKKLAEANEAYRAASVTAGNNYTQAQKDAAPKMEQAAQLLAEANTISKGIKFFS